MNLPRRTLLAAALFSLGTAGLSAQVTINEVNFTSGDQWIELYNGGPTTVSLGAMSIYHATKTPNRFQDYWWGFPSNATIASKDYLRINWGKAVQSNPPAKTLNTGDSPWNFLFGHGFEELDRTEGALAVCLTQDNTRVNQPDIFVDWWQWGSTGFHRGNIAIDSKLWPSNTALPAVPDTASLIILEFLRGFPHSPGAFDVDFTATPLANNSEGMNLQSQGQTCTYNTTVPGDLSARGYPFHGNNDFTLVTKTRGPAYFEMIAYIVRFDRVELPRIFGCDNVLVPVVTPILTPALIGETPLVVPLTDPSLRTAIGYVQAVVISDTSFSSSNLLDITISH